MGTWEIWGLMSDVESHLLLFRNPETIRKTPMHTTKPMTTPNTISHTSTGGSVGGVNVARRPSNSKVLSSRRKALLMRPLDNLDWMNIKVWIPHQCFFFVVVAKVFFRNFLMSQWLPHNSLDMDNAIDLSTSLTEWLPPLLLSEWFWQGWLDQWQQNRTRSWVFLCKCRYSLTLIVSTVKKTLSIIFKLIIKLVILIYPLDRFWIEY